MKDLDAVPSRESLQKIFVRALARRAKRREFVTILRRLLDVRVCQTFLVRVDRRLSPRG
jgi:hypothetical protein